MKYTVANIEEVCCWLFAVPRLCKECLCSPVLTMNTSLSWTLALWSTVLEKVLVSQLAFYGTWRLITVLTRVHQWSLSWVRWIQFIPSQLFFFFVPVKCYPPTVSQVVLPLQIFWLKELMVFTVMKIQFVVFWVVTLCSDVRYHITM